MDSTQKILKELSDLTRNLDVLTKEIRETNKISSQNQKTSIKTIETMENAAKKTEEVSSKVEKSNKTENTKRGKTESPSNPSKSPNEIFSNFINSIKNTTKKESFKPEKSSLASLSQPPTTVKDLSTLNPSDPEYSDIINKLSIGEDPRGIATAAIKKELETLKNKEKKTKEEEDSLKKGEAYIKEKESKEKSKNLQLTPSKPEIISKRDENRGFFEKLMEKISPEKDNKESLSIPGSSLEKPNKTVSFEKKEPKKDENKGFFSKLVEKIRPEKKEEKEISKNTLGGPSEKKSSIESITKSPELTEGQKIKQDFKNLYKESKLGKSVSEVKSLFTKENKPKSESVKTEMKKEGQTLKSPSNKEPNTSTSNQEKGKGAENPIIPTSIESISTPSTQNKPSLTPTTEVKKSIEGEGLPLTSDDIKEIKSLLGAINTSLRGSLKFKDNKPFRPKSNLLE